VNHYKLKITTFNEKIDIDIRTKKSFKKYTKFVSNLIRKGKGIYLIKDKCVLKSDVHMFFVPSSAIQKIEISLRDYEVEELEDEKKTNR